MSSLPKPNQQLSIFLQNIWKKTILLLIQKIQCWKKITALWRKFRINSGAITDAYTCTNSWHLWYLHQKKYVPSHLCRGGHNSLQSQFQRGNGVCKTQLPQWYAGRPTCMLRNNSEDIHKHGDLKKINAWPASGHQTEIKLPTASFWSLYRKSNNAFSTSLTVSRKKSIFWWIILTRPGVNYLQMKLIKLLLNFMITDSCYDYFFCECNWLQLQLLSKMIMIINDRNERTA